MTQVLASLVAAAIIAGLAAYTISHLLTGVVTGL